MFALRREHYVPVCVPVFAKRKRECRDVQLSKKAVMYPLRKEENMHEEDGAVPLHKTQRHGKITNIAVEDNIIRKIHVICCRAVAIRILQKTFVDTFFTSE